jgi:hypothetical protein
MPLRQRSARFLASLNDGGEVVRAWAFLQLSKSTDSKIGTSGGGSRRAGKGAGDPGVEVRGRRRNRAAQVDSRIGDQLSLAGQGDGTRESSLAASTATLNQSADLELIP